MYDINIKLLKSFTFEVKSFTFYFYYFFVFQLVTFFRYRKTPRKHQNKITVHF